MQYLGFILVFLALVALHASGDKHGSVREDRREDRALEGGMFVMGQLASQAITKPKGMMGSLSAPAKGATRCSARPSATS